jgi:predicted ATP-dependent protease
MRIDRTPAHEQEYAGLIAAITKREGLLPLDRGGVARVIEEGMRLAEDHSKLSILFGEIADIVREAAHWAEAEGASVVTAEHVSRSVRERIER